MSEKREPELTPTIPNAKQVQSVRDMVSAACELLDTTLETLPREKARAICIAHEIGIEDFKVSLHFTRGAVLVQGDVIRGEGSEVLFKSTATLGKREPSERGH